VSTRSEIQFSNVVVHSYIISQHNLGKYPTRVSATDPQDSKTFKSDTTT
jgi:hypothetical protein